MRVTMRRRRTQQSGIPAALRRSVFTVLSDSLGPGRGNPDSARTPADPEPAGAAQYVNEPSRAASYRAIVADAAPLWFPDDGQARISPMERLLIDYRIASGRPVGIIPCGVGGSSLAGGWNYDTPGNDLVAAKAAHTEAMDSFAAADGMAADHAGTIVALSSNDAFDHATLRALWLGLIDDWRAFLGTEAPFFLCGPAAGGKPDHRRLVEEIAAERTACFVVHPPYPTQAADALHPTMDENRQWGADLAAIADMARRGAQPVPDFATNPAQASDLGDRLTVNLAHSGLALASPYGVPVITGGTDAALFEIGGGFHAPILRWAGDGTGPASAGDYEVELRLRNSAWQLGEPFAVTVSRAAGAAKAIKPGHIAPGKFTGEFGGWTISAFIVKKGWNFILVTHGSGGFKSGTAMTVDGNAAILVASSVASDGRVTQLWRANAAAEATVALSFAHDGSPMSDIYVQSVATEGYAGAPAATGLIVNADERGPGSQQHPGTLLECPDGGAIIRLASAPTNGGLVIAQDSIAIQSGGSPTGSLVAGYRNDNGAVDYVGPGNFVRSASFALHPA